MSLRRRRIARAIRREIGAVLCGLSVRHSFLEHSQSVSFAMLPTLACRRSSIVLLPVGVATSWESISSGFAVLKAVQEVTARCAVQLPLRGSSLGSKAAPHVEAFPSRYRSQISFYTHILTPCSQEFHLWESRSHQLAILSCAQAPKVAHTVAASSLRSSFVTAPAGSSLFRGRGTAYSEDPPPTLERISQLLAHHRLRTWGFVVYRCSYDDDDAWARFMSRLDESRDTLPMYGYGVEDPDDTVTGGLVRRLDWRVQEDPAGLDGASNDEVRRRFRQLVVDQLQPEESREADVPVAAKCGNPRWNFCVHVDKESLNAVLRDDSVGRTDEPRCVNLIRADEDWDTPDYDRFDWSGYTAAKVDDPHDENEEEVEGSRRYDVGWMKVRVEELAPSLYARLMKTHLWDAMYRRPREISEW